MAIDTSLDVDGDGLRESALLRLRKQDPERAREVLQAHWQQTTARRQRKLLWIFAEGLSLSDEPWLEQLLHDPEIRDFAARLLATLPDSRFSRQVQEQILRHVTLAPAAPDLPPTMQFAPNSSQAAGARAGGEILRICGEEWMLQKLITYVRPAFWCEVWQISLRELVAAALPGGSDKQFLDALAWATITCKDRECAYILLQEAQIIDMGDWLRRQLIQMLTPAQQEIIAAYWLKQIEDEFYISHPAIQTLESLPCCWSEQLTRQFLHIFQIALEKDKERLKQQRLCGLLQVFGSRFAISLEEEIQSALDFVGGLVEGNEQRVLDTVRILLSFRQRMIAALDAEDGTPR